MERRADDAITATVLSIAIHTPTLALVVVDADHPPGPLQALRQAVNDGPYEAVPAPAVSRRELRRLRRKRGN